MSFQAGAIVGVADRMHQDNLLKEKIDREDYLRADQEDLADYHTHAEELRKMAADENVHPAAREEAANAYAQLVANGRQGMKPKDRAKLLMNVGQSARGYRARQLLGLQSGAQSTPNTSGTLGAPSATGTPAGAPNQVGGSSGSVEQTPSSFMDTLMRSPQMTADQASSQASSLPYLTPDEKIQQQVRNYRMITGSSGFGGTSSGNSSGDDGSDAGSPRLEPRLGKNGELTFSPVQPSYHFEQMTYVDPRDNQPHEGSVSVDMKAPGTGYIVDPQSGKLIKVRPTSKTRSDTIIPVTKVVNGKKVISYERRSSMAGQTIDAPVQSHSIVEPGADGNLYRRTYQPGFNGQPDKLINEEVVGRNPLVDLQRQSLATGIATREAPLFSPDQLDFMIQEENNGADMTKVPSTTYAQMVKRREEFNAQGHGDVAQLPDRYTTGAQNSMRDATRIINTTDRIKNVIDGYVAENGGTPSKIPYGNALGALAYRLHFGSADEFNKHLADMSILALNSGASVGGKGIRNWKYIEMTLQHTPEPGKDSMQLIIDKMAAIRSLNEDMIAAARDTGLKSGVVNIPGVGAGGAKRVVPKGIPSRQPVRGTKATSNSGPRDMSKMTDEELFRLATGGH
jgi:hypothetical protein